MMVVLDFIEDTLIATVAVVEPVLVLLVVTMVDLVLTLLQVVLMAVLV